MLELRLTQESRSTAGTSTDEWADVVAFNAMQRPDWEHNRLFRLIMQATRVEAITQAASERTRLVYDAEKDTAPGDRPSIAEARAIELAQRSQHQPPELASVLPASSEEESDYADVTAAVLQEAEWGSR